MVGDIGVRSSAERKKGKGEKGETDPVTSKSTKVE